MQNNKYFIFYKYKLQKLSLHSHQLLICRFSKKQQDSSRLSAWRELVAINSFIYLYWSKKNLIGERLSLEIIRRLFILSVFQHVLGVFRYLFCLLPLKIKQLQLVTPHQWLHIIYVYFQRPGEIKNQIIPQKRCKDDRKI